VPFVRRLTYELFLWTHGYLPILVIYALWYHIGERRNVERVLLLVVIGVFGVFELSRLTRTLYKNFTGRQNLTKAIVTERSGAIIIQLDLLRPWKIQPGDFVYLRCLSMPFPSLLESHPFSIAWWEVDDRTREEATTLYLLVSPQHGFTGRLLHRSNHNRPLKMIVDGPYGTEARNLRYDTILLFASGIGIAALMPFMKAIIDDHKRSRSSVRRISLIWEIDRESELYPPIIKNAVAHYFR
jgi:predicted ferric reductase